MRYALKCEFAGKAVLECGEAVALSLASGPLVFAECSLRTEKLSADAVLVLYHPCPREGRRRIAELLEAYSAVAVADGTLIALSEGAEGIEGVVDACSLFAEGSEECSRPALLVFKIP